MLFGLVVITLASAVAAGPAPVGTPPPMTMEETIADLRADLRPDRLYAARELRRRVRRASKDSQARPGSLRQAEARQLLALFDEVLVPHCIELMPIHRELRVPCAEILGLLLTDEALEILHEQASIETRRWAVRRIERAAHAIASSQGTDP